jgi:hypothetical protein
MSCFNQTYRMVVFNLDHLSVLLPDIVLSTTVSVDAHHKTKREMRLSFANQHYFRERCLCRNGCFVFFYFSGNFVKLRCCFHYNLHGLGGFF